MQWERVLVQPRTHMHTYTEDCWPLETRSVLQGEGEASDSEAPTDYLQLHVPWKSNGGFYGALPHKYTKTKSMNSHHLVSGTEIRRDLSLWKKFITAAAFLSNLIGPFWQHFSFPHTLIHPLLHTAALWHSTEHWHSLSLPHLTPLAPLDLEIQGSTHAHSLAGSLSWETRKGHLQPPL